MVLAQVKLMTGFSPDASSIADLKAQAPLSQLKRVDVDGKLVSFYLDQVCVFLCPNFLIWGVQKSNKQHQQADDDSYV